jgi:phosphoribosylaminoimidazole-succinocarboxamide synthase
MPVAREVLQEAAAANKTLNELDPEFEVLGQRYSGKVRENFTKDGQRTIIVTDRVSAFDVVLGTIPFKGQVLNGLARYWFDLTKEVFPNHVIDVPDAQVMRAVECEPIHVEFVVRGYLTGVSSTSIWRAYESGARTFCGHALAEGMQKHQKLPANIVTPSTKAAKGDHDKSVAKEELFEMGVIGAEEFNRLEAQCLELFAFGQRVAADRGMILVDTKYELGRTPEGTVVLIDEIHTPDSSRYWYANTYEEAMSKGENPKSLDKEYVRRWLVGQGYHGDGPPPPLLDDIRVEAAARYIETYEQLTGTAFEPAMDAPLPRIKAGLGIA